MKNKKLLKPMDRISGSSAKIGVFALVLLSGLTFMAGWNRLNRADAATVKPETVDIRIIGTTDLHGQLNSMDYEKGIDYNNGGLARVFDLITKTRNELPRENTVTLDAGDVLFDYTTEYIFSENQEVYQPIYQAMAMMGYDAITLGNHDFDYGYDYILRQLNGSGLRDIAVVSNVTDSKTGEHPFLENMIITRTLKTSSGKEVEVKIGIMGHTIPTLTAKTHSYTGILKTEDIIVNAAEQARKLKAMGADVIIALSHTGIGPENPELNFKNVAYALTKVPEIDVVVSGHEHNIYPTNDLTSSYYKLPGVDKNTYLMNGKNVVMAGSRGEAIGVVDLTLAVDGDSFVITDRSSEIRKVTAENTKENELISSLYGVWEEELLDYSTDIIGELKSGVAIQNYYGLLGDNTAIQLLNDSKMQYALKFVNATGKQYQDYPIIAASSYSSYGVNSINDYVHITDQITESDLSAIQPYNNYIYVYTITGGQLKEWLEWSASAYETLYTEEEWKDSTISELIKANDMKYLVREEWMNNWSSFYIFDGIDYVISPSAKPRYDISGNRINTTRRILSVKYNGVNITDDMVLLLATDKITGPTEANKGVEKQVALNGFTRSQSVLGKYIMQITKNGNIMIPVDYNWRVSFPKGYQFMIKTPEYADSLIKSTPWYVNDLILKDGYRYYVASYPIENGDTGSPDIIAAPLVTSATKSRFEVAVHVSDESGITQIRVATGEYTLDYEGWLTSKSILQNRSFTVYQNGIYSIYAEDIYGNKTVKQVVIDNFNDNLLSKPVVDTYTNRKTKISGTAEPNTKIIFIASTGVYESKVGVTGKFSYSLPAQPSGTVVSVYIMDEEKGLVSEQVSVTVKRTGPNQPSVISVYNNSNIINGDINDNDATIIAIVDDMVYVPENGGRMLYEADTEIYDKSLNIVETFVNILDNGFFFMTLPPQEAGKTITFYNIDHLSRNSRQVILTVGEVAPNAPVVYEVSNIEKALTGYVPDPSGKIYDITMNMGDKTDTVRSDKDGSFSFEFEDQLQIGQMISITASDTKKGTVRNSFTTEVTVKNIEDYVREGSENLKLNRVTSKSNLISGYYYTGGTVYLAIGEGEGDNFHNTLYILDTDDMFKFRYNLDEKLEPGTKVYAMVRFTDGRILQAGQATVLQGRPDTPSLLKEITNSDKLVEVIATKDCEVVLIIGQKTYTTKEYWYDEASSRYIYSLETDRDLSGTPVTITVINSVGTSDAYKTKLVKAAPDAPEVDALKAGDKNITGQIELYNYIIPVIEADTTLNENTGEQDSTENISPIETPKEVTGEEETLPEDVPATVAMTETKIFAKIGKKTYEGTIDNKGNFTITVPALKEGSEVWVWGTNKAGRGPLTLITITAE